MLKILALVSKVTGIGLFSLVPAGGLLTAFTGLASLSAAVVNFFATPFGRWVGIALIGAGLYVVGDVHRAVIDRGKYQARWAAAVEAADRLRARRDEEIRRHVTADAERRVAEIARESEQLQTRVADYEQALSTSNVVACRATDDDARRLRGLWSAADAAARRGAGGMRERPAGGRAAPRQGR